mgnify:CR=1 FL=1
MELNIRYDKQGDQFLLYVASDDTYGLEGRIVAKKHLTNDAWQPFNGMGLILKEWEAKGKAER